VHEAQVGKTNTAQSTDITPGGSVLNCQAIARNSGVLVRVALGGKGGSARR